jgi:hypothetical protein
MGEDEAATVSTLKPTQLDILKFQTVKGREVDLPGDIILTEFGSIIESVSCAAEIQRRPMKTTRGLPMRK